MSKYDPLTSFLATRTTQEVPMTFSEIEKVIGGRLPPSKQYPAWWSNNASNNVMTRAWLAAGFRTERVDIAGERLVFRRDPRAKAVKKASDLQPPMPRDGLLARLKQRFGGSVRVAEGVNLCAPTGETWDAER